MRMLQDQARRDRETKPEVERNDVVARALGSSFLLAFERERAVRW